MESPLLQLLVFLTAGFTCFMIIAIPLLIIILKRYFKLRRASRPEKDPLRLGFFHPYCNTGGGGERVLWCAIKTIQNRYPNVKIVVYTGDLEASPEEILGRVELRLNISFSKSIEFVYLRKRKWVEAKMYPYFTLLGQSFGSVILGIEALAAFVPDIFIDTMGYAFTFPLFQYIVGCRVACYVHYPTITSDMLRRVSSRVETHNNRRLVARSPFLTAGKLLYYKLFAWLYGKVGRCADIIMVNSSWTEEHITELWECPLKTYRVYPPCDVDDLKKININHDTEEKLVENSGALVSETGDSHKEAKANSKKNLKLIKIVSVAQFRPEKDHPLQLRSLYQLRQMVPESVWDRIRLVFIGACRNAEDEERVQDMKDLCKHLSLEMNVEFKVNISYEELRKEFEEGMIGLHAMWNEHFGIGVVECMAAGLIMIAHRSGGPQMDIIEEAEGSRNGFLALDETEYANAIAAVLRLPVDVRNEIRNNARASVDRFSVQEFNKGLVRAIDPLLH